MMDEKNPCPDLVGVFLQPGGSITPVYDEDSCPSLGRVTEVAAAFYREGFAGVKPANLTRGLNQRRMYFGWKFDSDTPEGRFCLLWCRLAMHGRDVTEHLFEQSSLDMIKNIYSELDLPLPNRKGDE